MNGKVLRLIALTLLCVTAGYAQPKASLSGRIFTDGGAAVSYATVALKGTRYGCSSDEQVTYALQAPAGR